MGLILTACKQLLVSANMTIVAANQQYNANEGQMQAQLETSSSLMVMSLMPIRHAIHS